MHGANTVNDEFEAGVGQIFESRWHRAAQTGGVVS
jgi:hypothetical protein